MKKYQYISTFHETHELDAPENGSEKSYYSFIGTVYPPDGDNSWQMISVINNGSRTAIIFWQKQIE